MEAIQLELFKEQEPSKISHTYMRKLGSWIFIDDFKRYKKDFVSGYNNRYKAVVNLYSGAIYPLSSKESRVAVGDKDSVDINMYDYFKVGQVIKAYYKYYYNKKLGSLIKKQ